MPSIGTSPQISRVDAALRKVNGIARPGNKPVVEEEIVHGRKSLDHTLVRILHKSAFGLSVTRYDSEYPADQNASERKDPRPESIHCRKANQEGKKRPGRFRGSASTQEPRLR